MLADIGCHLFRRTDIRLRPGIRRGIEQDCGENIRKVFGQQRFPDYASAGEDIIDRAEHADDGLRVGERKHISKAGYNILVPVAGSDSVEMTPEAFPAGFGGVGVAAVAVQKNKPAFVYGLFAAIQIKDERTLLDIHEQKAVKGFPHEPITRQIEKAAALQRIQKHFKSIFAGGVDKVF